jgi:hypothetical protein
MVSIGENCSAVVSYRIKPDRQKTETKMAADLIRHFKKALNHIDVVFRA